MPSLRDRVHRLPARAASQRAERHDDRLLAVRVRAVRARRAEHPQRAAAKSKSASRSARSSPTGTSLEDITHGGGRDREVSRSASASTSSRRSRRSSAREDGARRVQGRVRVGSSCRRRSTCKLKPGFRDPATVQKVADQLQRARLRRRHSLRRGVDHAALSPAQHRRRRRRGARPRVRGGRRDHHRRDDSHGGARAQPRDLDHAARRRDGRIHPPAVPDRRARSRACSAACSRSC